MGAFGADTTITGIQVLDGDDNVLWSVGPTLINGPGGSAVSFATGGVFAESLSLKVDLFGLGTGTDNIGLDNVHFGQRVSAVPEPGSAALLLAGLLGLTCQRRRKS